jgi:hypothetical protein
MRRAIMDACIPEDRDYEFSQTSNLTLDGQGVIVWDLTKNRASSVSLDLGATASDSARLSLMGKNPKGILVPTEMFWSADWMGRFSLEYTAGN